MFDIVSFFPRAVMQGVPLLFGGLYIVYLYIPAGTQLYMMELYKMLPYLVTIIVLVVVSMRKKRENEPPAALGLAYFREER